MGISISPTLLDSFRHYQSAGEEWADRARGELLGRLNGVSASSEAMQKGIDFEQKLCDYMDGKASPGEGDALSPVIAEIAGYVRGAARQVYVAAEILPGVRIHGYIDFLNANTVYDVKTTSKYEFPKYLHNNQHLAYMAALRAQGINAFKYLVTDFSGVFAEEYRWRDSMLCELKGRINEFLSYLEIDKEMKEAFYRKAERDARLRAA